MEGGLSGLGLTIVVVMLLETFLALVFIVLRFWSRGKLVDGGLGWDGHLLWISWVMLAGFSSFLTGSAVEGMGQHSSDLSQHELVRAYKLEIIGETFCAIGNATSKSAVAAFLLRICVKKIHKIILWWCIVSISIFTLITVAALYTSCTPVESTWNPFIDHKCLFDFATEASVFTSYSVVLDFLLAALPWHMLRDLHIQPRERTAIRLSLSLGVFAGICGIVRTLKTETLSAKSDYTYETVAIILWSSTELTVTLICVSIPALRPLFRQYISTYRGNTYSNKSSYKSGSYRLDQFSSVGHNTIPGSHGFTAGVVCRPPGNQSDEHILGSEGLSRIESESRDGGGIKLTRSVVVEFENTSEMDRIVEEV